MTHRNFCSYQFLGLAIVLILLASSCSVKKYVPKGKLLYNAGEIELIDSIGDNESKHLREDLKAVLFPEPNSKTWIGYPQLYFYYKAQREHPGFINTFLNKQIGEEPAYLDQVKRDETHDLLINRLENRGHFYSTVDTEIKRDTAAKTATAHYTVQLDKPYKMNSYEVEGDSLDSLALFDHIENSMKNSLCADGDHFNLKRFKNERRRIESYLKKRGYYNFKSDFLKFEVDTNQTADRRFNLYLNVKENVPKKALHPYVIDSIDVYPNYNLDTDKKSSDTTRVKGIDFIQDEVYFKPERLRPFIQMDPGEVYNPKSGKFTSRRISSIGNYKFVNINYNVKDTVPDSDGQLHLNSEIELSPLNNQSLRAELQAVTKSNNFTGPGLKLGYTNRNLFHGGEVLRINAHANYEKQFFGSQDRGLSSLEIGLKPSLTFPRLIFPIPISHEFKYAIPKTKIKAGLSYLNRNQLYTLNSYQASFGYIWTENKFVTHKLTPLGLTYVKLGNTSDEFESILDENPFLRRSFEQQFIPNLTYSFTYNEIDKRGNRGELYFNFNFDMSGNVASIFAEKQPDGQKELLGLEYAQYAKADVEFRYHYATGHSGQELVGRAFAGYGYAYGNSTSLPFVKQYFAGGPYSVRAFPIRSLGPGNYKPEGQGNKSYFDQAGDIRLEANIEYRFPIVSVVKGAFFADAGNVWLKNKNDALPGGQFSEEFYKQLGIGAGFGLRFDIQGFVLRFDLAAPLKRPSESWDFEYQDPVFNFAIGYPF